MMPAPGHRCIRTGINEDSPSATRRPCERHRLLLPAHEAQLLHPTPQGIRMQIEDPSGAAWPFDHPPGLIERGGDVGALHVVEGIRRGYRALGRALPASNRRRRHDGDGCGRRVVNLGWDYL